MPTSLVESAAATGPDGRIYVMGGYNFNGPGLVRVVEAYTPTLNSWETVASMPTVRGELAAATGSDGRIYAMGGFNGSISLNTVEAYSPSTNAWATVASLPIASKGLAAATGSDGRIYVLGGMSGNTVLNTVEAYTPSTNTWSSLASLPTASYQLAAATGKDGRIYAFGGGTGDAFLNTVEVYTPSTNIWTTLTSMPTARGALAAATGPDGRIYVMGGFNGTFLNTVEAYSPGSDSWTSVPSMPTARDLLSAATGPGTQGLIYAFGGVNSAFFPLDTVEALSAPAPSDTTPPVITYNGNQGTYTIDQQVNIICSVTDPDSAVASSTCHNITGPAYSFAVGANTFTSTASDPAGNIGYGSVTFTVVVTASSLSSLITQLLSGAPVASSLTSKVNSISNAPNPQAKAGKLAAFQNELSAQVGHSLTQAQADLLSRLATSL